ncbi:DNA sulfur modification protein DndD [Undibacterium sp. JH2W]|uniref:DNA sulfur modification protein DndD n=1 Tax=Undibacterium sp. JH2W TaxID=3413037 RepID=UPI003BF196CD
MIFEQVVLHNFGVYRGEHRIDLDVTAERPIVLIGALNGSGKTTFLDAMQLALYGKSARCSGRERVGYPEYLDSMINRDASPHQGAGVEFAFRARANGQDTHIRISRTWQKRGDSIKENLEVYRDGEHDLVASERWVEFVEDFMPSQIADLFFFDGEKIEALADPQRSATLLRVGIHSLLGIDLVESLLRSLQQVERKRKTDTASESDKSILQTIESQRNEMRQSLELNVLKRASIQNELDGVEKKEALVMAEFKRLGGDLLMQRDRLISDQLHYQTKKIALEDELRMLAAGALPLMIPTKSLDVAVSKAMKARQNGNIDILKVEAESRDADIEKFIKTLGVGRDTLLKLRSHLRADREHRYQAADQTSAISEEILNQFSHEATQAMARVAMHALKSLSDVDEHLAAVERNLAAVPANTEVAQVQQEMEICRADRAKFQAVVILLDSEIATIRNNLERLQAKAEREAERLGEQLTRDEVSRRVINHSSRAREVLANFRDRLLANNLQRLEHSILKCFQRLIRKRSLVHGISIDTESFQISVTNLSGQLVPAHRLSAGERQLLAVATLWALAHASGRYLPAVIDTPLSRLDSKHRGTLVQNYFPTASHQVILLSTDEEVVGTYQEQLRPFVGRHYLIEHDELANTSRFVDSYFPSAFAEMNV